MKEFHFTAYFVEIAETEEEARDKVLDSMLEYGRSPESAPDLDLIETVDL